MGKRRFCCNRKKEKGKGKEVGERMCRGELKNGGASWTNEKMEQLSDEVLTLEDVLFWELE